jgi:general secretion pathway protein A
MYEVHFGLREKPFALVPDPEFLYLTRKHAAALSTLEYALTDQAGFVVITGEVGSGKTTLIRKFLKLVDRETTVGLISNTHSAFGDLLAWILLAFDVRTASKSKAMLYQIFVDFLLEQYSSGRRTILIIDEAQNMSRATLEELRLLSNVNADKDLLLQIILVGQPELLDKLRQPNLRQFAQRISANYHLAALSYPQTRGYIRHRVKVAGGNPHLFTEDATAAIHYLSGGVPRIINSICDMALVYGFAESCEEIDLEVIATVVEHKGTAGLGVLPEAENADLESLQEKALELREQLRFEPRDDELQTNTVPLELVEMMPAHMANGASAARARDALALNPRDYGHEERYSRRRKPWWAWMNWLF